MTASFFVLCLVRVDFLFSVLWFPISPNFYLPSWSTGVELTALELECTCVLGSLLTHRIVWLGKCVSIPLSGYVRMTFSKVHFEHFTPKDIPITKLYEWYL